MIAKSNLSQQEIDGIINSCQVCHIAMVDGDGLPYVLPFNFYYTGDELLIHGSPTGRKNTIWQTSPSVCVAFSNDYVLRAQSPNVACSYSMKYRSVLLHGKIHPIDDIDEKQLMLSKVMKKYTGRDDFQFVLPALKNVAVYRIVPTRVEGKTYGY